MDPTKRFLCPKCGLTFQFENELIDHKIKHTTSPPNKRSKVDFLEWNPTNKEEEDMDSEVVELIPEGDDEEMPEIKQPEVKTLEERKPANKDSELDDCFQFLSNIHECKEDQFKLRYENMRLLKEEKNSKIEDLTKVMEEVKLENATLNFIARTIDNPKLVEEVIEENNRLLKENKELVIILELRNKKILDLELQPPIKHTWRQETGKSSRVETPKKVSPNAKKTIVELEPKDISEVDDYD